MSRLIILYNTVRYMKKKQVFYRFFYFIRLRWRKIIQFLYPLSLKSYSEPVYLQKSIKSYISFENKKFTFINLLHTFKGEIDWNFSKYGKLWTYNLTYFDYLNQTSIETERGVNLIYDFIDKAEIIKDGFEPFPISLRSINWIKFLVYHEIEDQKINDSLYAQYYILLDNIEYHLLGNHLLENGFSLLFGGYYYKDDKLYRKAKEILTEELEEQILNDGAHFELSPMYHQIMLYRVLDCINLVQNNDWKKQELLMLLATKAEIMLGWLNTITLKNGNIPLLNDSANHVAPTTKELNEYAYRLNVKRKKLVLSESGYRKKDNKNYEMIVDIGKIGPDYIPGHAHSDTFNFEVYLDGKPFVVDTGISTYEASEMRLLERSTASHNTVQVDGLEQSEIWSSFRVAKRAHIIEIEETANYTRAIHDGYKQRLNILHQREFMFEDRKIKIIDTLISKKQHNAIARIHFYPDLEPVITQEGVQIGPSSIKIKDNECKIKEYNYTPEFNKHVKAKMLEISFKNKLEIEIII